jgi:NFU1 iron-sulfur cluster scaffold homolog, mitochondrial
MPKIEDIEYTPNPNARKFILKEPVTNGTSRSYTNAAQAADDDLALSLFSVGNVTSVFYMDRFITVNQDGTAEWDDLLRRLAVPIREAPSVTEAAAAAPAETNYVRGENELLDQINDLLDAKVRPGLAGDGGGLEIISLEDKRLTISYQGACGSCPSSLSGTLYAIEHMLKDEVDPDLEVISV